MVKGQQNVSIRLVDHASADIDHAVLVVDSEESLAAAAHAIRPTLPQQLKDYQARTGFKFKPAAHFSFEPPGGPSITVWRTPNTKTPFERLRWARRATRLKPGKTVLALAHKNASSWLEQIAYATLVQGFTLPKLAKPTKKSKTTKLEVLVLPKSDKSLASLLLRGTALAEGTNLVRELAVLPSNHLTPTHYRAEAERMAKEAGLKTTWISLRDLEKMGAGAFHAVAKGSHDPGSGILKVHYTPKNKSKSTMPSFALVGKGLCYDTGGFNLKTGGHMFGMHGDMTGSAVALALCLTLKQLEFPASVTAYLALTENILAPNAYRPNDVIKTLTGKTIEIVDTDAEGRMVLSDTLTLASREKPTAIVDFATLTGSCVRAIGTGFSGAYTNRKALYSPIRKSGVTSGERVWPFPNDRDYGKCLKSEIADIKQCRENGGSDHIEAGYFLGQFVEEKTPWIHIDLSASENEGGLGAVPTKVTGFGVRFGVELLTRLAALLPNR